MSLAEGLHFEKRICHSTFSIVIRYYKLILIGVYTWKKTAIAIQSGKATQPFPENISPSLSDLEQSTEFFTSSAQPK